MVRRVSGGKGKSRNSGGTRPKSKRVASRNTSEDQRAIKGAIKSIASSVSHMERFMKAMNNKIGTTDRTVRSMATGLKEQDERMTRLGERVGMLEKNVPLIRKVRPGTTSARKSRGSAVSSTSPTHSDASSLTVIPPSTCPLAASLAPQNYQTSGNTQYITLPASLSPFTNPKSSGPAPSASFASDNTSSSSYTTETTPIPSPESSNASCDQPPPCQRRVRRKTTCPKAPKPKKKVRRVRPSAMSVLSAAGGDPAAAAALCRSCLKLPAASRPATSAGVCPCSCPDGCCCRRGGVKRCASCSLCNAMANAGNKNAFAEEFADALGSLLISAAEKHQQQQQEQQGCWCCNGETCRWCPKGKGKKKIRKVKKVKA